MVSTQPYPNPTSSGYSPLSPVFYLHLSDDILYRQKKHIIVDARMLHYDYLYATLENLHTYQLTRTSHTHPVFA
jgi:hypothetical protein